MSALALSIAADIFTTDNEDIGQWRSVIPVLSRSRLFESDKEDPQSSSLLVSFTGAIMIHEVPLGNSILRRHKPLFLTPSILDGGECFRLDLPDIGASLAAYTISDLEEMVADLLASMWEDYAMGDEFQMTEGARLLRKQLRENYSVV